MYISKARGKNQVQLYGTNRRAHRRINARIGGEYRVFEEEAHPFSTLDISEHGLRVSAGSAVAADSLLEFTLKLPEQDQKVSAVGRVIRTVEDKSGAYQMAITIVEISGRAHLTLKRYLREKAQDE